MNADDKRTLFVRLLTQHERRIYAYILSLVPNWHDADEIAQETNVQLWKGFDLFEPGTNFAAWALRIAHFQVLTWRKKAARSKLVFSQEFIDIMAAEQEQGEPLAEARHRALGECIGKLNAAHRELISRCYSEGAKIKSVAENMQCSSEAIYKRLQRIRRTLHRCINRQLATVQEP